MPGKFIVIEGTDGSGKTEQFKLLTERLEKSGVVITRFDFPQYGTPSAYFAEKYLNGGYGTAEEVGPHRASIFFALDRYEASFAVAKALEERKVAVSNRYVGSNLAHQGGKLKTAEERKEFFERNYTLEYEILGIPKPDINIVLHMPAAVAQKLIAKKSERGYLKGKTHDIHEADLEHLKHAEETYLEMVNLFPQDFRLVECVEGDRLLSIEEIHEKVWKIVSGELIIKDQ